MKRLFLIVLLLVVQNSFAANVDIKIKEVSDKRTTGKFFKGLNIDIEVKGKTLSGAQGMLPMKVNKASSNLGENLIKKSGSEGANFFSLRKVKQGEPLKIQVQLKNPSRKATHVQLKGELKVYIPDHNPANSVTIDNYLQFSGKPIKHKNFKSRGISFIFFNKDDFSDYKNKAQKAKDLARQKKISEKSALKDALGEALADAFTQMFWGSNDLSFIITDPDNQILKITLFNDKGKEIETSSRTSSNKRVNGHHGMDYKKMLPYKGKLVVQLAGKNNIKAVPVNLSVPLP
ncbi:MAG: hypothetical protein GXP13_08290 [Gammaproteobacteria bacterium]|nr:hypothetical protein [Gammaproteobacteria bacterium]